MKAGLVIQTGAAWIGCHYSPYEERFCICIIPFITIWICKPGGRGPKKKSVFQVG